MKINDLIDRTCIFGLNETGKTTLAKKIVGHAKNPMVFDIKNEYQKFNRYTPETRQYPDVAEEFDLFYKKAIEGNSSKYNLLLIDECNRVAPNKRPLPYGLSELNDFYAPHHMDLPFISICRRPSQLNTDLVSLTQKMVIFRLTGKSDKQRLNQEVEGLGDTVAKLKGHNFVVVYPDRTYKKFGSIKL